MSRIDVFYGRTDNTPGYKEYSCVVVRTGETGNLKYYGDLYEPAQGCNYEILYELPMSNLPSLCARAGVSKPNGPQWIQSPLKDLVLQKWKSQGTSGGGQSLSGPMFVGFRHGM